MTQIEGNVGANCAGELRITRCSAMLSPVARFFLSIVGSAVYLGFAVLGWGGFVAFFSNSARTALAVATLLIGVAAFFAGGNLSRGVREDRSNRWVIAALTVIGLVAGYLPALTDRLDFWTIDGDTVRWLGVGLYAVGGALRLWPVYVLGTRFSGLVAIQPGHALVTTGIYSVIRHPSYLGLFVIALGWALAFRSVVGVLLALLTLVPLVGRIVAEERLLHTEFGSEYDVYRARTSRLIPGVW
jgi:protein-S-isoprenylcysteine O-methyltransferase Ste14